jgi:XapX domain-containing protein
MASQLVLALLTGVFAGALFSFIKVTIPAPPNLPGILGIVGIYLGYKGIEMLGVHVDLPEVLLKIF